MITPSPGIRVADYAYTVDGRAFGEVGETLR